MRAVIQRVTGASVCINHAETRSMGQGLLILLGVKDTDTEADCDKLAEKCAGLRIFDDENGNLNLAATDLGFEAMVVSNFTLYGNTKKGKRPSFIEAAKQPLSEDLYERFVAKLRQSRLKEVHTGVFGADMQISLVNDGPITLVVDTDEWKTQ